MTLIGCNARKPSIETKLAQFPELLITWEERDPVSRCVLLPGDVVKWQKDDESGDFFILELVSSNQRCPNGFRADKWFMENIFLQQRKVAVSFSVLLEGEGGPSSCILESGANLGLVEAGKSFFRIGKNPTKSAYSCKEGSKIKVVPTDHKNFW